MEQIISEPRPDDLKRLEEQRAEVEKYLGSDESNLNAYHTPGGKLGLIRAILDAGIFDAKETYKLQCLGIVLGDAFVQDMGFHWIMVEDEYGRDPAIRFDDTSVIQYPLTMISKRIERGETVDVFELYNGVAAEAQRMIDAGY
jgi:hypothetical protein